VQEPEKCSPECLAVGLPGSLCSFEQGTYPAGVVKDQRPPDRLSIQPKVLRRCQDRKALVASHDSQDALPGQRTKTRERSSQRVILRVPSLKRTEPLHPPLSSRLGTAGLACRRKWITVLSWEPPTAISWRRFVGQDLAQRWPGHPLPFGDGTNRLASHEHSYADSAPLRWIRIQDHPFTRSMLHPINVAKGIKKETDGSQRLASIGG